MKYIPKEDVQDHVPKNIGEQVHVNHDACTAGKDTRGRLYIKRTHPHKYVAYCHNCGMAGAYNDIYKRQPEKSFFNHLNEIVEDVAEEEKNGKYQLPDDYKPLDESCVLDCSGAKHSYQWLINHDITPHTIHQAKIGWSERWNRLIFPIGSFKIDDDDSIVADKLRGWQGRSFHSQPKWFTALPDKKMGAGWYIDSTKPFFVVEDIVSCLRLVQEGQNCIALLGTHMSDFVYSCLIKTKAPIHVWLDNDKAGIAAAHEVCTRLRPLHTHGVISIYGYDEPKKMVSSYLQKIIKDANGH